MTQLAEDSKTESEFDPLPRPPGRASSKLWPILGFTMLGCAILMLAGFVWSLKDAWFPSHGMAVPEPSASARPPQGDWAAKQELKAIALGDSLTRGMGDRTGDGYVRDSIVKLNESLGKKVRLLGNLAINGLTATRLNQQLEQPSYASSVMQADLILFTIGGNDLFRIAQSGGSIAQGGDVSPERLKAKLPEAKPRLEATFSKLRRINPYARIVYVGLFNPFYDVPEARGISETIAEWNAYAQKLAALDGNATVIPTYDLFESNAARYLSSDHFHPNEMGYGRIAERIDQALN
ncbi:GDSL-type esterase/lipase family protein [Cohnella thailandensis]|uniref:GDSL family lipase n=1 Tax=Cohnella thailandensis TaxID=557557 RepID=A0A841T1P9_9BACL|nr:GDSL family lipase [Cohnella thailandensis]MBP1973347.1 lysophospholipase L1-like esterase [Cohnella thailandensis]